MAIVGVASIGATPVGRGGASLRIGSVEHVSYASADGRVGAAPTPDHPTAAQITAPPPLGSGGALTITPTFDSSITSAPNAAAIEAAITDAITIFESVLHDPITVSVLFRYATTYPDGTPLPPGALAVSSKGVYLEPWNTYIGALTADATSANDVMANASLPGSPLSTDVDLASANGRAVGLATSPAMFANGSVGPGGPYDGIVTIDSGQPFTFTRPPTVGMYDAERSTEHEIDEVLGFGSSLDIGGNDIEPQDLFSWSAAGARNLTSSGSRYFSIDGGSTDLVGFNQQAGGDFGDWLSATCPQATPYVQNAFSCADQATDVSATSPEGINLDVIGYDLVASSSTTTTTVHTTTTTVHTTTTVSSTTSVPTTTSIGATTSTSTLFTSTSTTLQPGTCLTVADCSDGDPCTDDACNGGACSHAEETGAAGVACHIQVETASPICVDGTATALEPAIQANVAKALAALQDFDSASAKKMKKLRKKAKAALTHIATVTTKALKKHKVSSPCAASIESIVGDLRGRVAAL